MTRTESPRSTDFLEFIRRSARELRRGELVPSSVEQWQQLRARTRSNLVQALGLSTDKPAPVSVRKSRQQQRDGYTIEHLVLGTRATSEGPIEMPANAYVPATGGRHPAVLCVHGHWSGAKQDPVVQARCIGLARLGFVVLSVDAFGAGERGLQPPLGEYHGEMVAATLWPTGTLLAGLQVWDNMRAVDYLQTRPDVDPGRIGVTGTSGGGNQTIYVGALDDRLKCVVPVCSVGNYQAYLGAACCMCELVPGALTFTELWQVLGLVAPRGLMAINATRDAIQFSVAEARKSMTAAQRVFDLYDRGDAIRHVTVESGHDYNKPMREAMYGWMTRHLKGQGDGAPIAEPKLTTVDRESIRVWPGKTRPKTHITLPQFARQVAVSQLKKQVVPVHAEHWEAEVEWRVAHLQRLCRRPKQSNREASPTVIRKQEELTGLEFEAEQGVRLTGRWRKGAGQPKKLALLVDLAGLKSATESATHAALQSAGWDIATLTLRATGESAPRGNRVRRAIDHNASQWAMWIGRPLMTQWVTDLRRFVDVLGKRIYGGKLPPLSLMGLGSAGAVAVTTAAVEPRVQRVVTVGAPVSVVSDRPFAEGAMGILLPGSLQTIGDLPQVMSLLAPRPLSIINPVSPTAEAIGKSAAADALRHPLATYRVLKSPRALKIVTDVSAARAAAAAAG
ncbi:MAG: acetylxylan esterase [Planctomycetaceae bacterium]|jgi:cephalosporin-C deacetylase-like acetyl esterase|nr:acetylxylan esterase [Planctomycetaceae bacterium]MDP7276065.1 acetylxylan esterase [Planctomycetaceae bacterium]